MKKGSGRTFLIAVAAALCWGCSDDSGPGTDGSTKDAPVTSSGCQQAGGICGCSGGCSTGYHAAPAPLLNQCPQPCANCGACSMQCCLPDDAGVGAPEAGSGGGVCGNDTDCGWRQGGCCGICANKTEPVSQECGSAAPCPTFQPQCLCVAKRCTVGALQKDAPCDLQRDTCGLGLKCCATCCGTPAPDGGHDPRPRCMQPQLSGSQPMCPAIP